MTTTLLKLIALILMLIDHIAAFIPGCPIWFRWLGRLSAPLFFFCLAQGFYYTRDKKRYLMRLYLASIAMAVICVIVPMMLQTPYMGIENNFFRTLFISACLLYLADMKQHDHPSFRKYTLFFILYQVISTIGVVILLHIVNLSEAQISLISALLGNLFIMEGGLIWSLLGVVFYLTMNSKKKLALSYLGYCVVYSAFLLLDIVPRILVRLSVWGWDMLYDFTEYVFWNVIGFHPFPTSGHLLWECYQWMLILALPFILLYNGQKGKGFKYLFYIFYPVHIVVLYVIGNILSQ